MDGISSLVQGIARGQRMRMKKRKKKKRMRRTNVLVKWTHQACLPLDTYYAFDTLTSFSSCSGSTCLCVRKWASSQHMIGVSLMVDVGNSMDTHQVFDKLSYQHKDDWNSLILDHLKSGRQQCAFDLYDKLRNHESIRFHKKTFLALLKVCTKLKDIERGLQIHAHIARTGLLGDIGIGSTIIYMYSKCGLLTKAHKVFSDLSVRNAVSWTALITGYTEHGHAEEAFQAFEQMQCEGVLPDAFTFSCILKACGSVRASDEGCRLHANVEIQGLVKTDLVLGNTLVDMYAKSGALPMARRVFTELPARNVVAWTALISGYVEQGLPEDALKCFEEMKHEGISPDAVTLVCILKAFGSIGPADKGEEIFVEIERRGLQGELVLGNTMLDMYAKCGLLVNAHQVFEKLLTRDVFSWNALIAGYVEHEQAEKAVECFEHMQLEGVSPNVGTFVCAFKASGILRTIHKGIELHTEIERLGLLEKDPVLGNALLIMYIKCGFLALARQALDRLPMQSVVSWTALIGGYADNGHEEKALQCFHQMQDKGLLPSAVTFISVLKACGGIGASHLIGEVHAEIERRGLVEKESDNVVATSVVDVYAKCGLLALAREVFNELSARNIVTWNALIAGYVDHGHGEEALKCLEQMQVEGVFPDAITFICSLNACSSIGATKKARELHAEIDRQGLLESHCVVANTLIDVYVKFGLLGAAREVFDKLPSHDVISWTTLILGYSELGYAEVALDCLECMQQDCILPNAVTLVCVLKACGSIGASHKVQELHSEMERQRLLEKDFVVGNTLVDSYAKCGLVPKAQQVFDKLPVRHVVSWTALMAGYVRLGENESVFVLYDRMLGEGMKPDAVTFMVVLNACSSSGLFKMCQTFFEVMSKDYGIIPTCDHYACMVDLLSRIGYLDKAAAMMQETPFCTNLVLWHTVLNACRSWGNMGLGRGAFEHAVHAF